MSLLVLPTQRLSHKLSSPQSTTARRLHAMECGASSGGLNNLVHPLLGWSFPSLSINYPYSVVRASCSMNKYQQARCAHYKFIGYLKNWMSQNKLPIFIAADSFFSASSAHTAMEYSFNWKSPMPHSRKGCRIFLQQFLILLVNTLEKL
jgi:hypothetical protein